MSIDDDLSVSLPKPPPPNPSRREAAIEAALRRFDGADEADAAVPDRPRPPPPWWTRLRQPQFGVAVSLAVVAVIGLPAALIAIRDQSPAPVQEAVAPAATEPRQTIAPATDGQQRRPPPAASVATAPPAVQPPSSGSPQTQPIDSPASRANDEVAAAAPPSAAFAPAAPPPPPPPAPQAVAENVASQAGASDMVVTGSRVRSPSLDRSKASKRASAAAAERSPDDSAVDPAYGGFLTRLQTAIRTDDRGAVIKLINFPLRVNSNGGSRSYPNARSVERDFDRIFTPGVKQAILAQRPDQLFTRDQGAMIGDGEVWFDHTCPNAACSPLGPVRIKAMNP